MSIQPSDLGLCVDGWRPGQWEAINSSISSPKRFVGQCAPTGCHAKGTLVLLVDGTSKPVECVAVGDVLLGPDSAPRKVLKLHSGEQEMVRIIPLKGEPFIVNMDHILAVKKVCEGPTRPSEQVRYETISVRDWLQQSRWFKHTRKLYRPQELLFDSHDSLPIEPYFLGVLLGDGSLQRSVGVCTADTEIVEEVYRQAQIWGLKVREVWKGGANKAKDYYFSGRKGHKHALIRNLSALGLRVRGELKCIPYVYKSASPARRRQLLAGLLDTDGDYANGVFSITSKSGRLAWDVVFICRSLGLAAYAAERVVNTTSYWRVTISGELAGIPTKLRRKQAHTRRQKKDVLATGFRAEPVGRGMYFGFEVGGDNLYLTADFLVHHNSGKSLLLVGQAVASGMRTLILTSSKALQRQYEQEFSYLNILDIKGKSNYSCRATEVGGEFYDGTPSKSVAEGPCQFGEECGLRLSGCTYYDKTIAAKYKKLVSANYAAWISANMYTEGWGHFDLIACDEAHEAEDWLARMLAVKLPRCYTNLTGSKAPTTTNVAMWVSWANRELPMIRAAIRLEKKGMQGQRKKRIVKLRTLQSLEASLTRLRTMTSDWKIFPDKSHILFQPIWVHDYTESLLFNGASKVVFASSTIVPNTLNLLGITDNELDFFSYPSTFPVERRPIYYYPVLKMKYGLSEEEEKQWVNVVDEFISRRLDRKGIIHTVSYARQALLLKYSRYASLMVASSPSYATGSSTSSANMTLQRFRMSPTPCILVGPNWSTGINLPLKECEYSIVPKMPFADITDPLHVARSEDNPDYGLYDAGMTFTQTVGRHIRSQADQGETLVTDAAFGQFITRHRRYIPDWIWAAVKKVRVLPDPLPAL